MKIQFVLINQMTNNFKWTGFEIGPIINPPIVFLLLFCRHSIPNTCLYFNTLWYLIDYDYKNVEFMLKNKTKQKKSHQLFFSLRYLNRIYKKLEFLFSRFLKRFVWKINWTNELGTKLRLFCVSFFKKKNSEIISL